MRGLTRLLHRNPGRLALSSPPGAQDHAKTQRTSTLAALEQTASPFGRKDRRPRPRYPGTGSLAGAPIAWRLPGRAFVAAWRPPEL